MSALSVATGFDTPVAMAYSANRNVVIVGEGTGRLTVLDIRDPGLGDYERRVVGDGYRGITHLAYDDISDRLIVADADGTWLARLPSADRSAATAFTITPVAVLALNTISMAGSPAASVLEGGSAPRIDSYNLGPAPGTRVDTLLDGLEGATGAAIADSTSAFLLASCADGTALLLADWRAATVTQMSRGPLPFGDHVVALDSQCALVVSNHGAFACVRRDGTMRLPVASGSPASVTAVVVTRDDLVVMATADSILEDTLPADVRDAGAG
jgi:hypothetical protein